MDEAMVIELARMAVGTTLLAAAPMMVSGLVVGLLVSVFQAATQINEQTMAFAPKVVAVLVALVIAAPWILHTMLKLAHEVFGTLIV